MARFTIESDELRAEVDTELGGSLTDLSLRGPQGKWFPVLRRAPAEAKNFDEAACYPLAPWSNRIPGGRFVFVGRPHAVEVNWPDGSAIHGEVCRRPWNIVHRSPGHALLEATHTGRTSGAWPWTYLCGLRYEVDNGAFIAELSIVNLGTSAMPVGLGFHPYFNRVLWNSEDRAEVTMPNSGRYPSEGRIPVRQPVRDAESRALGGGVALDEIGPLDDVFVCAPGEEIIRWPASGVRATLWTSPEFGHRVVYSPPAPGGGYLPFFSVEPVSHVTDGFNLASKGWKGTGVRVLPPGERLAARWRLTFEAEPEGPQARTKSTTA